tara:strand:- start:314 stop:460 length:147 start_codon:yes stop_codon:yes gene_type:complete
MSIVKELDFVYICSDGTRFIIREEAIKYEEKINAIVDHYNIFGDLIGT